MPGDRAVLVRSSLLRRGELRRPRRRRWRGAVRRGCATVRRGDAGRRGSAGRGIGGGLGLALSADFRVASPSSRFAANFARLGIHHGFGLTVTLPAAVGDQAALELLYTGRRVGGEEARALGLCDRLAGDQELRAAAHALAGEIAVSAPLAVRSIRKTMRGELADRVRAATRHEGAEQAVLFATEDFREGVRATAERRTPRFNGR